MSPSWIQSKHAIVLIDYLVDGEHLDCLFRWVDILVGVNKQL